MIILTVLGCRNGQEIDESHHGTRNDKGNYKIEEQGGRTLVSVTVTEVIVMAIVVMKSSEMNLALLALHCSQ